MLAPIIGATQGMTATPSQSATTFMPLCFAAQQQQSATESVHQCPVSEACTIRSYKVTVGIAPGAGAQWVFTVRINGVSSAATVTISGTNTTASITGLSVAIADGDLVNISIVPTGTPAFPSTLSQVTRLETVGSSFLVMGAYMGTASNSVVGFYPLTGLQNVAASTETTKYACPMSATLTRLRARTTGTPGGTATYAMGFRQNGTDTMTATVASAATTALATGSVALAVGDLLDMRSVPTGTPTSRGISWCMSITPAISTDSFLGNGSTADAGTGNTTTFQPAFGATTYSSESTRALPSPDALVIKNLIVVLAAAPGGAANRTVTMRDNGSSTALTVSLTGATTQAQDTTHTATLTGGNVLWALQFVSTGTPVAPGAGGISVGWTITTTQPNPTANDTVTVSDAATRVDTNPRTGTDNAAVSDIAATITTHPRSGSDTVAVSDVASASTAHPRMAGDTVSVGDTAVRLTAASRTAADTVTQTDQAAGAATHPRTASDAASAADQADRQVTTTRTATDTTVVSDTAAAASIHPRTATDSATVSDTADRLGVVARTANDTASTSDAAVRLSAGARTANDIVGIADQARSLSSEMRIAADLLTVFDEAHRALFGTAAAADIVGASDALTLMFGHYRTASDLLTATDTADVISHVTTPQIGRATVRDRLAYLASVHDLLASSGSIRDLAASTGSVKTL